MPAEEAIVDIARVGAQGDGVGDRAGTDVFVPFTLAGERVAAEMSGTRGHLVRILEPSPDRVAPVCRHFGRCGGCSLQHMADGAYAAWKRDQVVAAFAARGLSPRVGDLLRPAGRRRRAVLTGRRDGDGLHFGFHEAQSHALVDVEECPVLMAEIVRFLASGRPFLSLLASRGGEIRVTVAMSAAGLDVSISGVGKVLTPALRSGIAREATATGLARVSIEGEPVFEALEPFLVFGGIDVPLPPGAFIQAVEDAEAEMVRLVLAATGKAKRVADLFAGLGAFTFPLARRARVLAVDSDRPAIAALERAGRTAKGVKPITPLVRDLFREPLSPLELGEYDAVVFDPPRAGAEAQARKLARSKVATVVAVSCNPATLARDARILVDGGYELDLVTPIDQFRYSPHVEAVAVFHR